MDLIPKHGVRLGVNSTFERYLCGKEFVISALVLLLVYSTPIFESLGRTVLSYPWFFSCFENLDGVAVRAETFSNYEYGLGLLVFIFLTTHALVALSIFFSKPLYVRLGLVRLAAMTVLGGLLFFLFYYLVFIGSSSNWSVSSGDTRFSKKEGGLFFFAYLVVLFSYLVCCLVKSIIQSRR